MDLVQYAAGGGVINSSFCTFSYEARMKEFLVNSPPPPGFSKPLHWSGGQPQIFGPDVLKHF